MNVAIILAGGKSERLSIFGKPKQFLEIAGKSIISYVLEQFEKCRDIDNIIIVASKRWQSSITTGAKFLSFSNPGTTRQESILNALRIIDKADKVIIHDAARPLVNEQMISSCLDAMNGYDGATPCVGVTDTIYQSSSGNVIEGLLERDSLYAGQTPECYDFDKYFAAHKNIDLSHVRGSSEIAFTAGMHIHLYHGDKCNIKITNREDLDYFEFILGRRQ